MLDYLVSLLTYAALYGIMALALNLVWGMGGMINLGLVGFYAIGAYVSALATIKLGVPIALGAGAALVLSAALGSVVALATVRLRSDYLAIVTLGFAEVVRIVASNEIWLTNGTDGISNIPGPLRGAVTPETFNLIYLTLMVAVVAAAIFLLQRLARAPFGRALRAIRDDDQVAAVAGKPVLAFKAQVFAVSAGILGLAGSLYAHYSSYVAPDSFQPLLTIYIVLALVAGGRGNNYGAILGAVLVVAFTESTRFLAEVVPGLQAVQVAALRQLVVSVGLLLILRYRPGGILPERILPVAIPARRSE
ncbi:MAG TPA: branched-chain amino acid ABC transporter permease [Stellaceae bacterium]|nr:branched-chain amino acid ABC transporter permease [Stellaceae bacterium]